MNDNDKKNKQELPKLKDDKLVKNSKKKTKTETKNTSKKTKSTSKKSSSTNTAAKKKNTTTKNKTISSAKTTNTVKKNNKKKIESKDNTKKEISSKINKEIKENKDNNINKAIKEEVKDNVNNISIDKTIEKENKNIIEESLENKNDNTVSKTDVSKMEKVTILNTNDKKIKSPKSIKDVIKETSKKIPNEKIVINDNSLVKNKNYKNELKDINNNKEFAKAIWDTDDITEAIKTEANNQEKLNNEIDEMLIKERKYNSFEPFIIIILLILCFLGLYFILFTKDSAIINSALTNINNNLTSSLSELNTIKEELNKGITGTATLDTTSSLYASLKDFTYDFSLYNKNNNFYGNIKLSKDDKTINNTYSYLDKNLYIATPLYYFPIQINNPIKVNPLSINYSNLNNNIEVIKNYLTNNITYTSSNKGKEELNGEKLNVLTLDFSEYDFNNSIQKILNAIANDSELLKSIAKDIGLDEVTVNDLFNTNVSFKGNYKIKIYTKGILQTFVGLDIYNDDKEILEYLTDGNTTLNIYGKKKLSINLSNDKFLIYVDDIKLIDIKSNKNKNDLINLDFQVSNILNNYQGSVVLTKFDNNKGSFLFSFKDTNNNDVSAEIKMDLVFGDIKGNEFDYTDAVLIDDITEDELLDIKNNLFNAIWDQVSNPEETVNNNNNNEEPSN
ncbi:unknown [Mycoplasma sp. CAG:956]|nr:unknown [Mycoplasma sp. CAG:956]